MSKEKIMMSIDKEGTLTMLYNDKLADLCEEGNTKIERISNVEPAPGGWKAYMLDGVVLGPYRLRQEALDAEVEYLNKKLFEEDQDEK